VPQLDAPALLPDGSGRSLFELDLEALERKDWRLPGSDISDWFNYGFDEFTWVEYVRRRREMEGMVENMGMVRLDSLLPCPSSP
jgi:pre-mRNA 3'-end-processing factor FIP1